MSLRRGLAGRGGGTRSHMVTGRCVLPAESEAKTKTTFPVAENVTALTSGTSTGWGDSGL